MHLWAVTLLGGCGPDLAELETEQRALEREVRVLRRNVADMRERMQSMGMLPSGPTSVAEAGPDQVLEGALTYTVTRSGTLPELPALGEPERRANTECGWRLFGPWLEQVSDLTLEKSGSGKSSPIVLSHNGRALEPHATVPKFERACEGAFRVQPRYVFFSPFAADDVDGTWTVGVADTVPLPRGGDGRGMYWVYPGTELAVAFQGSWNPEWGEFGVSFDSRLLAVGTAEDHRRQPTASATVEILGEQRTASAGRLGLAATLPPPSGPFTLTVASPQDGPWVLVETLWVGNDEQAVVVTAEGAP